MCAPNFPLDFIDISSLSDSEAVVIVDADVLEPNLHVLLTILLFPNGWVGAEVHDTGSMFVERFPCHSTPLFPISLGHDVESNLTKSSLQPTDGVCC